MEHLHSAIIHSCSPACHLFTIQTTPRPRLLQCYEMQWQTAASRWRSLPLYKECRSWLLLVPAAFQSLVRAGSSFGNNTPTSLVRPASSHLVPRINRRCERRGRIKSGPASCAARTCVESNVIVNKVVAGMVPMTVCVFAFWRCNWWLQAMSHCS